MNNYCSDKFKGFDDLLSLCLSVIQDDISVTYDLGINGVAYSYSDFKEEFTEEFKKFDFVSEYNFMQLLYQYICYEVSDSGAINFNDDSGAITVYFSRFH